MRELKIVYRASSQFPLVFLIEELNLWQEYGIEPKLVLIPKSIAAEKALLDGEVQVVLGNHMIPYRDRARGLPLVFLAQSVNNVRNFFASKTPITSLQDIIGKRIAMSNTAVTNHPGQTMIMLLKDHGITPDQYEVVETGKSTDDAELNAVIQSEADLAFLHVPFNLIALERGLNLLELTPFPMVWGVTVTTTSPNVASDPEIMRDLLRVLIHGIKVFKTDKQTAMQILEKRLAPLLGIKKPESLEAYYHSMADLYESKPYPTLEAIQNVYRLAALSFPEAAKINPLVLWDLSLVRELDESGFIDSLYQR